MKDNTTIYKHKEHTRLVDYSLPSPRDGRLYTDGCPIWDEARRNQSGFAWPTLHGYCENCEFFRGSYAISSDRGTVECAAPLNEKEKAKEATALLKKKLTKDGSRCPVCGSKVR